MRLSLLLASFVLVCVCALTRTSLTQRSSIGYGVYNAAGSFKPDFSSKDLKIITRVLRLSADERTAVDTLYEGYKATLRTKSEEVQRVVGEAIERAEIMQDSSLLKPAHEQMAAWEADAEKIKKVFLADLRSLLSGDQESRWPIAEREMRRARVLGEGRLFGESVDILQLLDEVAPESFSEGHLAELVESYAVELDRAAVARATFLEANQPTFSELCKRDPQEARHIWKSALHLRQSVRDVNERYVRLFAAELPKELAEKIQDMYFDRAYARLVKPTRGDNYLASVIKLDDLGAEQKDKLEVLRNRYNSERKRILKDMATLERTNEETWMPASLAPNQGDTPTDDDNFRGQQMLPKDHPLLPLRQSRFELDQRMRVEVRAILTAQQSADLPYDERASAAYFADYRPFGP